MWAHRPQVQVRPITPAVPGNNVQTRNTSRGQGKRTGERHTGDKPPHATDMHSRAEGCTRPNRCARTSPAGRPCRPFPSAAKAVRRAAPGRAHGHTLAAWRGGALALAAPPRASGPAGRLGRRGRLCQQRGPQRFQRRARRRAHLRRRRRLVTRPCLCISAAPHAARALSGQACVKTQLGDAPQEPSPRKL